LPKPQIKICISSTRNYAAKTLPLLIKSLTESGISGNDIYVFEGGHPSKEYVFESFHHYLVAHNSIDFTALIEVAHIEFETCYWFFLHDTCIVGKDFKRLIENIPHFMPDTLPIKDYPSMNIGAYKHTYLKEKEELLQRYINKSANQASLLEFKEKGVQDEDILFRQSKNPFVYNGWKLLKDNSYKRDDVAIPDIYTNRVCEYFPQVALYKFKANYHLELTNVLEL
jgi:hypothetical protein